MSAPPDASRTCGSCTLCCKVMVVDELAKPAGSWCPNCAIGSGCRIYESRPGDCREFVCQWLVTPEMPDSFRPDRIKVVLAAPAGGMGLTAHCDTANPMAWRKEPIYAILKRYAAEGWGTPAKVLARAGDRLWLVTPKEDIDLGEVPAGSTYSYVTGPDGRLKVTIHPPS